VSTSNTRSKRHAFSVGKDRTGKTGVLRCKMCRHSYERCRSEVIGCEVEKPDKPPFVLKREPLHYGELQPGESDVFEFEAGGVTYWGELTRVF
jgi:hypothetical protein